jgi:hypothetical protein
MAVGRVNTATLGPCLSQPLPSIGTESQSQTGSLGPILWKVKLGSAPREKQAQREPGDLVRGWDTQRQPRSGWTEENLETGWREGGCNRHLTSNVTSL